MTKTVILIPSRMGASRLPGKPLLKINNLSIISHVFKKAKQANIGEVVVATENNEILEDVKKNGGRGILTRSDHKTGTDRIFEAYKKLDFKNIDFIFIAQRIYLSSKLANVGANINNELFAAPGKAREES